MRRSKMGRPYSITSSARASSVDGTASPRSLAVLRLEAGRPTYITDLGQAASKSSEIQKSIEVPLLRDGGDSVKMGLSGFGAGDLKRRP
jgi:hypothetical protein